MTSNNRDLVPSVINALQEKNYTDSTDNKHAQPICQGVQNGYFSGNGETYFPLDPVKVETPSQTRPVVTNVLTPRYRI